MNYDYVIIGGGIIGLTCAYKLLEKNPELKLAITEKENDIALHASGRNSGVLHAGFYYGPGSLKAKFTVRGNQMMKKFCEDNHLKINYSKKVVVAQNHNEVETLRKLAIRGQENGVDLEIIDLKKLNEIAPNVQSTEIALYSPNTATVDPKEVCQKLKEILQEKNVDFYFNNPFLKMEKGRVICGRKSLKGKYYINCAGLYADKVARFWGCGEKYTMLPFKGLYLKYNHATRPVDINVYPVPHPKAPFLGVHYTVTHNREIKIGPTAIPAFWREHYGEKNNFNPVECFEILKHQIRLFIKNKFHFRTLAFEEMKKYIPYLFKNMAKPLLKDVDVEHFNEWKPPGIRAQLLNLETDELVQDFVIETTKNSLHVLNSVSPAFTCSFAIAEHLIEVIHSSN